MPLSCPRPLLARALAAGLLLAAAGHALAADWPQWLGPQRNGRSAETGLLPQWPAAGPPLMWHSTDVGKGYGSVAAVAGRLYLTGNEGLETEFVQAVDARDGRRIWRTPLGKVGNPEQQPSYPGARTTPTVERDRLWVLGSDGDLACLNSADGSVRWRKQLRREFGGAPGVWAYSESPLVDGETLVCTPGGTEATLLALNKNTGAVLWKCAVPGGSEAAYSSPIVVETGGTRQYVQFLATGLVGVEARTGRLLWSYERTAQNSITNIQTPVAAGNLVYSAGSRSGGAVVRLVPADGGMRAEQVYFIPRLPTHLGGALLHNGFLYGSSFGGGLVCAEFTTGAIRWQERGVGPGSLCYADGRIYVQGEGGQVALVEATPEGYRERGRFTPPRAQQGARIQSWTYPVISGGRLYLRDQENLWCYDVRAQGR